MTSLLVYYFPIFKGSCFQLLLANSSHSHTYTSTFPFQKCSSHYVTKHQVIQPCTCKEYTIVGYFPISQSKLCNIMMPSIMYRSVLYCMLGLGQWVEQCNQTMLGFQFRPIASGRNFFCFSLSPSLATQCLM